MAAGELGEWNTEKRYVRPDGEVRWGALRALLLHDAEGRNTACLALIRDVTQQRQAERRRAAAHGVLSVMASGRDLRDALPALLQTVVEELAWERGALRRCARRWSRASPGSAGRCGAVARAASRCSRRRGRAGRPPRTRRAG